MDDTRVDPLTGFCLRESLAAALQDHVTAATLHNSVLSVGFIDIDRFARFTEAHGPAFGEELLKYFAGTMRLTAYAHPHYFFRYGDCKCIVIFRDSRAAEAMLFLRQCARNFARRPFLYQDTIYKITLSSGIAEFPRDCGMAEELVSKAEGAMSFSKRHGGNRITVFGQIPSVKVRILFSWAATAGILMLSLVVLYRRVFISSIEPFAVKFKTIRILTKPKDLEKLMVKDGTVFEGRIIGETNDQLIMRLYLDTGEGEAVFKKSDITHRSSVKH